MNALEKLRRGIPVGGMEIVEYVRKHPRPPGRTKIFESKPVKTSAKDVKILKRVGPAPAKMLETVGKGSLVKLVFSDGAYKEGMWVQVTSRSGSKLTGKLDNKPVFLPMRVGQKVSFSTNQMVGVW